ncbi:MAG: FAD-dependent oxidoreductase [Deltaproteobacteria bacterium]|nr:FAD-dependent oxidoreductase [Deltaproteobacteria bacterium]
MAPSAKTISEKSLRGQSFWHSTLPTPLQGWPQVESDLDLDVAIVGAGFTGLWTAYYLATYEPSLRIGVFEANRVGFGASGRNGGWCVGTLTGISTYSNDPKAEAQLQRALFETVGTIGQVCQIERIDCDWHAGGWLSLALSRTQETIQRQLVESWHGMGFTQQDVRWLDPEASRERVQIPNYGALYTPHCAALHPAKLVHGLARAVSSKGVKIYEGSPVREIQGRKLKLDTAQVRAHWVIRATEAYTDSIRSQRRRLMPMHSAVIATEPLSTDQWDEIGLKDRETFGDCRRMVIYGQRTRDDRMVFGCRGNYRFGSGIDDRLPPSDDCFKSVESRLAELFPHLPPLPISHRWVGALGIPRTYTPSVGFDAQRGFGFAGGYVGEGVAASNLAGRILADLCLERDTPIVHLPMVGHDFSRWEPEPLRWIGVNGIRRLGEHLDQNELTDRPNSKFSEALFSHFSKG